MLPQVHPSTDSRPARLWWKYPDLILERVFLQNYRGDYILLFSIGFAICLLSRAVGVDHTRGGMQGFLAKENFNWWTLPLLIPLILFLARKFWSVIVPPSGLGLPFLDPIVSDDDKRKAYAYLRSRILGGGTLYLILSAAVVINIIDIWDQPGRFYWSYWCSHVSQSSLLTNLPPKARDWSVMFLLNSGGPSAAVNATFVLCAYVLQFAATALGLSFVVIAAKYNLSFLSMIYQRRYVARGAYRPVVIDIEDEDGRFGFQRTNQVFTAQIILVFVAGIILLLSRIVNIDIRQGESMAAVVKQIDALLKLEFSQASIGPVIDAVLSGALFPDAGQVMIIISWLLFFSVAMLPVAVKLLPAFPNPFRILDLVSYLREFLPDGEWAKKRWEWGDDPDDKSMKVIKREVASRFAQQHFWPNGDPKARWVFFLAFTLLFMLVFPFVPPRSLIASAVLTYALMVFGGWVASAALFRALRAYLDFIGPELNKPSEEDHD